MARPFYPEFDTPDAEFARRYADAIARLDEGGVGVPDGEQALQVVALVVQSLVGFQPAAFESRLTISPALPPQWDWMEARGLRCGGSVFDVRVQRGRNSLTIKLERTGTLAPWIVIAPLFADAATAVDVDGQELKPRVTPEEGAYRCVVEFQACESHDITFTLP